MTYPDEEWKPVVGFEDIYAVSCYGRVMRVADGAGNAKAGYLMRQRINTTGYPEVVLSRDNRKKYVKVHKLVASAFIGPRPASYQINHKDADKTNPRAQNLEYVTRADNYAHAVRNALYHQGEKCHLAKLTSHVVREIRNRATVANCAVVAREFGIHYQTAWNIIKRRTWMHIPPEANRDFDQDGEVVTEIKSVDITPKYE